VRAWIGGTALEVTATFKAGKDLAVGDGVPVNTIEPKLPARGDTSHNETTTS
jgi:hypothetical protein